MTLFKAVIKICIKVQIRQEQQENLRFKKKKTRTSPVLCLGNPTLLDATFEKLQGENGGLAKALRSVECGVCLRGEKICHFGVVVYSHVREGAPMRGFYAPPYLPPSRPPPLLFHPHTH